MEYKKKGSTNLQMFEQLKLTFIIVNKYMLALVAQVIFPSVPARPTLPPTVSDPTEVHIAAYTRINITLPCPGVDQSLVSQHKQFDWYIGDTLLNHK